MLLRPEPTTERVEPTILNIIAIEIRYLTRFALLLQLRIFRLMSRNHVATWAEARVGKHFLRRATLKILLLPRAACSHYIYYIYNRIENLKKVLHELPQNEVTIATSG